MILKHFVRLQFKLHQSLVNSMYLILKPFLKNNGVSTAKVLNFLLTNRQLFISKHLCKDNHYDILGITPKATQTDIKSAYYKLSMLYHPDRNKGSDEAANKFRAITAAYEVLGNFRLRRLYDKGVIESAESKYREPPEEDDAQTRFYKQHMKKSARPEATGRTPIYDFDEWSRSHYGTSFNRRQKAKQKFDEREEKRRVDPLDNQKHYLIFLITILSALLLVVYYNEFKYDKVIVSKKPIIEK